MMPGEGSRALTTFLKLGIQQAHSALLVASALGLTVDSQSRHPPIYTPICTRARSIVVRQRVTAF